MNQRLEQWNELPIEAAVNVALAFCGSRAWATQLSERRPYASLERLLAASDEVWLSLKPEDWIEAFQCHPRIGEPARGVQDQSAEWSEQEQSGAHQGSREVLASIASLNEEYEKRHGFTYIVSATGKSAEELRQFLQERISRTTFEEIREAAEQQRQITHLRVEKWLQE